MADLMMRVQLAAGRRVSRSTVALFLVALVAAGCGGGGNSLAMGPTPGPEPRLSVERFLAAVNIRDLDAMSGIFGTSEGPIRDTGGAVGCGFRGMGSFLGIGEGCVSGQDVELRMDAIAEILRNDSFQVVSERRVAGRVDPTVRVGVNLVFPNRTISDVAFVTVQGDDGIWFLEEIDLEKVTGTD